MATTIVTKSGSGAPTASDLVAGELAVDLTNGRLYTEDSGGTVLELGLNPNGNVNVTGNVTADGLTVDSTNNSGNTGTPTIVIKDLDTAVSAGQYTGAVEFETSDASNSGVNSYIRSVMTGTGGAGSLTFGTGFAGSLADRVLIDDNGDISFYEDTGTTPKLFWDASAESLGIGTSSPAVPLHIENDASTSEILRLGSSTVAHNTGIYMRSTGTSAISWGSGGNLAFYGGGAGTTERMRITSAGQTQVVGFDAMTLGFPAIAGGASRSGIKPTVTGAGAGQLQFLVGGDNTTEATTIAAMLDASGNLLVGTTTAFGTTGTTINAAGLIYSSADGDRSGQFDRTGVSDGEIVRFTKAGATVGSIGTKSGDMYVGTGNTTLRFNDADDAIYAGGGNGNGTNNGTDLGSALYNFGDLYLSGGVYLGGTGAANKLEDYEEGTFTASLRGGTAQPATLVTTTGYYTKIGRTVNYNISFEAKDTTGYSGAVSVSGLPFANNFGRHTAAAGVYSLASWTESVIGVSNSGGTIIDLMDIRSGNSWATATHAAGTTRYLWLSGTYMTTA